MSQTNIAITQLAQLGLAERIAQEMQGHPEVTRQAAQHAASEALKQQKESIGKTEDTATSRSIKADKDGSGGNKGALQDGRRKGEPPPEEGGAQSSAPWSGNIVNVKV